MTKPRIFISHSAKDDLARETLERLYDNLRGDFDVLLDRKRLEGGDEWRDELYTWMGLCHAAIILFSNDALNSKWVLQEATVLNWRRALDERFLVLPILLPPVTPSNLDEGPFAPLDLNRIQSTSSPDIIARVRAKLEPLIEQLEYRSPLDRLEDIIAEALKDISPPILEKAAEILGLDLGSWVPGTGLVERFTVQLFHANLETMTGAVKYLAPYLDQKPLYNLIEILIQFWVDPLAVACIPEVVRKPGGQRGVGLNAKRPFTARVYIRRACSLFPEWIALEVPNVTGEDVSGALARHIRSQLTNKFDIPEDELNEYLEYRESKQYDPIFILISDPLDSQVLENLRQKFPSITFFVLYGNTVPTDQKIAMDGVIFLKPSLDPQQETEAFFEYRGWKLFSQQAAPQ